MTIQYASDLHLEFRENEKFLKANPLQPVGDVLVLAGDVVPFGIIDDHDDFFQYLSDHFKMTYWIPGNHEYYYFDAVNRSGRLFEKVKDNVILINNIAVEEEGVKLIFTTLWSKISPANAWHIERGMSDFRVIKHKGKRFTAEHYNRLHEESMAFLEKELKDIENKKSVVVTHHVPTLLNYPEKYKGSALNEGFAVELHDLIDASGPDYWIYGHHHQHIPDFKIGKTTMLTNQLGYVQYGEHEGFDNGKFINL